MPYIILFWKPIVEILILWFVIYQIILFFEGTRAIQVIRGLTIILVAFFLVQVLRLDNLDWLLTKLFGISIIAVLVIFHPEIRQGLARLGQRHIFRATLREEELDHILIEIGKAIESLNKERLGALIAIENKVPLGSFFEDSEIIDARVSSDLIQAIFTPNNPLHDGGIIIRQGRIMAAGCLFPLAQSPELSRAYGTRHRAALGLSNETDALVIAVSEERGDFSLVYQGKFYRDLNKDELVGKIKAILKK